MTDQTLYLVWSHEHAAWWAPACDGYETRLSLAGRYTQDQAFRICADAIPGAHPSEALRQLPVRLDDILSVRDKHIAAYGHVPWSLT